MQKDRSLVPRAYGEEAQRGADIATDSLSDAVAFARSDRGRRWREWWLDGATKAERSFRPALQAVYCDADEALPRAEPIYVDEDVTLLVETAARSLPATGVLESDLLTPSGFVWLARPIPEFWGSTLLTGFAWMPVTHLELDTPRTVVALVGYGAGMGGAPKQVSPMPLPDEKELAEDRLAQLAASFWLLAGQKLLGVNRLQPTRPARRRVRDREIRAVRVVTLRRRTYPETDGSRSVEWSHRWSVSGHWRQQWIASEQRHRPTWVSPYVKGPADKPFVPKRRAFEFKR